MVSSLSRRLSELSQSMIMILACSFTERNKYEYEHAKWQNGAEHLCFRFVGRKTETAQRQTLSAEVKGQNAGK